MNTAVRGGRKGRSLNFHLFLSLSVAVIGVGFATGWISARMEKESLLEELVHRNDRTISMLRASLLDPLITGDVPVLRTMVERLARTERDICHVKVSNEAGQVLVDWQRDWGCQVEHRIRFRRDILFEGGKFGGIEIAWSFEYIEELLRARMERVWIATLIPLLALLLLILLIVHWLAIHPVEKIYRRVRRLIAGDLETPLEVKGSRELRLLAETVNRTMDLMRRQQVQQDKLNQACEQAFQSKELAEVTLHSIGDAVITTDRDARITYLNPVAEKLTGWSRDEALGRLIGEVFFIVDGESGERIVDDPVTRALETGEVALLDGYAKLNARDGCQYAIEDSAAPIRSRDGGVLGAVLVFHDVTEQRRMAEKINFQATHDPLTGLFNRRAFEQKLQSLIEGVDQGNHVLLYLDLDQFKVVNDTCGHAAGDALLNQLGEMMRGHIRTGDHLARLGGDEFAILLCHCPLEQAVRCAEKIRESIQAFRFFWNGNHFSIGVSIGLVPFQSDKQTIEDIMGAADQACFAAKDAGRNRVHVYQPDDRELVRRRQEMNWVAKIHQALERDAFQLYFQPIVPVRGGCQGIHYEILLRMHLEDGELVPPGAFMPAAERYDLMGLIDRWVITHFFRWLAEHPRHLNELYLAEVNISGVSVSDRNFLDFVIKEFETTAIPPEKICFEVTETVAIANMVTANIMIEVLSKLGCSFALDDFGTGMSSFGYLKNIPVDYLKIDGAFVKGIAQDSIDRALVKSINEVGHIMNKRTIAEFVEDKRILIYLKEIGVDYAQGYGIGKPLPLPVLVADEFRSAYNLICSDS